MNIASALPVETPEFPPQTAATPLSSQNWHLEMVLAGIGGLLLFVSTCMFVYVAVGTLAQNERAVEPV